MVEAEGAAVQEEEMAAEPAAPHGSRESEPPGGDGVGWVCHVEVRGLLESREQLRVDAGTEAGGVARVDAAQHMVEAGCRRLLDGLPEGLAVPTPKRCGDLLGCG